MLHMTGGCWSFSTRVFNPCDLPFCCVLRSTLLALHRTAVLRHDDIGQETLLVALLRSYLAEGLYEQVHALGYSQVVAGAWASV